MTQKRTKSTKEEKGMETRRTVGEEEEKEEEEGEKERVCRSLIIALTQPQKPVAYRAKQLKAAGATKPNASNTHMRGVHGANCNANCNSNDTNARSTDCAEEEGWLHHATWVFNSHAVEEVCCLLASVRVCSLSFCSCPTHGLSVTLCTGAKSD